jgi:hypothetical protein
MHVGHTAGQDSQPSACVTVAMACRPADAPANKAAERFRRDASLTGPIFALDQ